MMFKGWQLQTNYLFLYVDMSVAYIKLHEKPV